MAISRQVTLQREEEGALFSLTGACPSQLLTQVTVDVQSCTLRMYVCVWLSFGRIRSKSVTVIVSIRYVHCLHVLQEEEHF